MATAKPKAVKPQQPITVVAQGDVQEVKFEKGMTLAAALQGAQVSEPMASPMSASTTKA